MEEIDIAEFERLVEYQEINYINSFKQGAPKHFLPHPLILSIKTMKSRMRTVSLTLRSLFCQSVRPDRFILWIDHGSFPDLPDSVLSLIDRGLEIRETDIRGPLGKYLPARNEFPDAVIVTADDDNLYWMSWLNELILAWNGSNDQIVCHRAHRILFDRNGLPLPYSRWAYETRTQLGADLFPTGCMGVLYPPGCHHPDVRNMEKHNRLCPKADDIWLYWMGRLAGASYRNIASIGDDRRQQIQWPGTQENCLAAQNISKGNDIQLDNMIREYGWMSCYNTVINSDIWMKYSKLLLWDNLIKKVKLCICAKLDVDVINVFDVDYLGIIFYGPYLSLEPGNYVIKFELSADSCINITGLKAEVCHALGHEFITERELLLYNKNIYYIEFCIDRAIEKIEIRLYKTEPQAFKITKLAIEMK